MDHGGIPPLIQPPVAILTRKIFIERLQKKKIIPMSFLIDRGLDAFARNPQKNFTLSTSFAGFPGIAEVAKVVPWLGMAALDGDAPGETTAIGRLRGAL